MTTKIYVAASYPRKSEAVEVAFLLTNNRNNTIVSDWITMKEGYDSSDIEIIRYALRDFKQVKSCDVFVCLIGDDQSRGGSHTELGISLALEKRVILIGEFNQIFHWYPKCEQYKTINYFKDELKNGNLRL